VTKRLICHPQVPGELIEVVEANPEVFHMVKDAIDDANIKGKGRTSVLDQVQVKAKGRPKLTRLKSSMEVRTGSSKCGACGDLGLNARKHRGKLE